MEANPKSQPDIPSVDPMVEVITMADQSRPSTIAKTNPVYVLLAIFGLTAICYFARIVIMPVILACIVAMTLKPLIRWLSSCHLPPAVSSAIVLCILAATLGIGLIQVSGTALTWMNEAPQRITELRQRVQSKFPCLKHFGLAAAAVNNLGATDDEQKEEQNKAPSMEIQDRRGTSSILDQAGTILMGGIETLVLVYLFLASGDLFLLKLVRVMPTMSDKKRVIAISHEIQKNISHYLLSVSIINVSLGVVVGGGLYFMGLPNAVIWGLLVAALNFIPYFGPIVGVVILVAAGLLTFDSLLLGLLPSSWYLLLHLLEANLITPVLLGRRFTLNPVVIFVSLIFWTWLWGVPGALLSVPILVSIKVICDRIPTLSSVSELLAN